MILMSIAWFCSTMLETASTNMAEMKTWVSEYNFPAMLSRCKFPKEYDAIHELQTNRYETFKYIYIVSKDQEL